MPADTLNLRLVAEGMETLEQGRARPAEGGAARRQDERAAKPPRSGKDLSEPGR